MTDPQLTEAQIANWRKTLVAMVGPYALIMPAEQIQAYRDRLQAEVGEGRPQPDNAIPTQSERNSDAIAAEKEW